ncbi:hypothetical protein V6N11_054758 [Hibiscus sabdariffa]|uniref:Uncharacterized protein n=1 Tax=Hibiscus sabdariffa TaxID=183260 RepID=A0ABR2S4U2_9ROSI
MLRLYLCKGFNNLLEQDEKGDVSAETTGPAPAEVSAGIQISAEQYLPHKIKFCCVLLAAETLLLPIPRRGDYSDRIAGLIEFPFLPRPRISADVRFSADVFFAHFWVFSLGVASVQLLLLRSCCL